nr:MAG TPA: hypothetical protein [Bacteriophage sp.]
MGMAIIQLHRTNAISFFIISSLLLNLKSENVNFIIIFFINIYKL